MDKISIASSQAVLEMSSFSVNTRSMSSSPLVNSLVSLVKNRLFNIRRCMTAYRSRNPQELRSGLFGATAWTQVSLAFLDAARSSSTVARARCSVYWCTVLLEHKVVTRHTAYRWQQYDVIMTS